MEQEYKYVVSEMVNLLWSENKFVLVEPHAEKRTGKLLALTVASRCMTVPPFTVVTTPDGSADHSKRVVKSLADPRIGTRFRYATLVDVTELKGGYPWFIHEYVNACFDVTVVYIRDQVFGFSLRRDFIDKSIDWRACSSEARKWACIDIPARVTASIREYMRALRLHFGRLDFLVDDNDEFHFCEVNPNGQYGWLDLDGQHGVLAAIVREISPLTECYPLPVSHPLATVRS